MMNTSVWWFKDDEHDEHMSGWYEFDWIPNPRLHPLLLKAGGINMNYRDNSVGSKTSGKSSVFNQKLHLARQSACRSNGLNWGQCFRCRTYTASINAVTWRVHPANFIKILGTKRFWKTQAVFRGDFSWYLMFRLMCTMFDCSSAWRFPEVETKTDKSLRFGPPRRILERLVVGPAAITRWEQAGILTKKKVQNTVCWKMTCYGYGCAIYQLSM